ncbi:MAG: FtsW/RodA/SpoVE family cell cycle protein, partial [Lentisphaeria bacterium]|nr:FtsW/RodA/SpoVE family cell cycle protein [Lentisphaeria bacterium]
MRRTPIATIKRAPSKLKEYIFKFDFLLFFSMLFLLGVGLIFIYSTGFQNEVVVDSSFFYKQLFWITISLPLYLVLSNFDYRYLKSLAVPLYLLSLLLLIAVLFIGVKIYGAKRWLDLGFSNFQPSELMKLSLILILSTFFCRRNFDINRFENLFVIGLLTLIPFILIFVEPDFGSALILLPLAFGMIFAAGIKKKYILIGVGIFAFFATLLTLNEVFEIKPLLKNYHRNRIMAFIDADKATKDLTHQSQQAAIAVATGG